jgi:molybdopterin molybdotransferase
MNAPNTLLSLDQALEQLKGFAQPYLQAQSFSTFEVDNRVLRQDVVAALSVPSHNNSAMDGYALRVEDVQSPGVVLKVSQRIPAGQVGSALGVGEAARIFTGAPVPFGANAVVMQEDCEFRPPHEVVIKKVPKEGQSIRFVGEDIVQGATILRAGTLLTPAQLGMAASLGCAHLLVSRKPKVALFSTGDELIMPGDVAPSDLELGKIYNSNRFFLKALLIRAGCDVQDLGNLADSFDQTRDALREAASHHDLILTSGGVSVGEEDHIKACVKELGELHQWALAIKPGKPFAYGRLRKQSAASAQDYTHFIGLPGNPVSSYVTFLLLVMPFLQYLQGATNRVYRHIPMRANFDWLKADRRREFLRVRINEQGSLDLFPNQSSGVLTSVVWADGVVDNAAGQTIRIGETVNFIPLAGFLRD